jgi:hypothetical protein
MKHLKIAGLCLVSMFAMGLAGAATASAAPVWEQCTKGPVGAAPTKYSENQCSTLAQSTGEWNWREVNNTEEVRVKGSIRLTDTNVPIVGKVSIECSGETIGSVGPGKFGRIEEITTNAAQCRNIENCEEIKKMEARHLPYQGELFETEKKVEGKTTGTGNGEPAMTVECKVLGVTKTDECEYTVGGAPEIGSLENKATSTELLVLVTALKATKQKCSIGGEKSGEQSGSAAILLANGTGLRVS